MRLMIAVASSLFIVGSGSVTFLVTAVDVVDAPRRLDAADLDGDGDVDLLVLADGAGQTSSLQVLLNGGGDFAPGWSAVQGTGTLDLPWDVDLADTNGDGDPDLLYVLPSGGPFERFNDGSGSFTTFGYVPAFAQRAEQEPADTNGDGDVDLVYYEEDIIGYFGTLQGSGDGSFEFDLTTEIFSGLGSYDLARRFVIRDVTGDGLPDAAMASKNGLQFIQGKPPAAGSELPGWLAPQKIYTTPCLDVVMVDLDGDARLDIVASAPSLHAVVVLLTLPSGGFGSPSLFPAGTMPDALAAADLDLDGAADVIVANPTTAVVSVLRGSGSGGLEAPQAVRVGRRPTDVVAADLDGDGDTDLAVSCATSGHVALLRNESL